MMEGLLQPRAWIKNLDELAEGLGVPKITGAFEGILLTGKTGQYSLVDLLAAHVKLMQQTLDHGRSCGRDGKVY